MKEQREVVVVIAMASSVSPREAQLISPQHRAFPTPSPFSFSITSTRWSSRPSIFYSNILLRFLALLFSFASALALAAPSPKRHNPTYHSSFSQSPQLLYCFIVATMAFVYSTFQLFKGVCDITHKGILITDMTSDYLSFILDQLVGYLLVSSSSVMILAIQQMDAYAPLRKASVISVSMSFATFIVVAVSMLHSGYKLCKRIIW